MEWYVKLKGTSDLERLSKLPESSNYRITKERNEYILKSRLFTELEDVHDVDIKAKEIISRINSISAWLLDIKPPVKSHSIARTDDTGKETQFILPESIKTEVKMYAPTILINGVVQGENIEEKFKDVFDLAVEDKDVSDLLGIFRDDNDWYELYKIYEIIRASVGDLRKLSKLAGLQNANQLQDLTKTMHKDRHIRTKPGYKPPRKTYTIKETRQIIRKMIENWLDMKLESQ